MTGHRPCRVNQSLLSRLLRDDWDFDKINISHILESSVLDCLSARDYCCQFENNWIRNWGILINLVQADTPAGSQICSCRRSHSIIFYCSKSNVSSVSVSSIQSKLHQFKMIKWDDGERLFHHYLFIGKKLRKLLGSPRPNSGTPASGSGSPPSMRSLHAETKSVQNSDNRWR